MKIAPFLLCAQISCALVAALDGILSEGVKVSELFDRSELAAENGYQVGYGQKGLPKRLWRREDQESQVEKRSIETEENDELAEEAKDKWTSFSEGLNTRERWVEVEKRSGGVFKRQQALVSVNVGGFEVKEEHILAFILAGEYKGGECQAKLKDYCGKLKGVDGDLSTVDGRVKGLCEDKKEQQKCTDLQKNIKTNCETLKNELEKVKGKFNDPSKLEDKDCTKNEPACFFLDGRDDNELKKKCNGLGNACYQKKRNEVAVEVLMRALSGDLKDNGNCKTPLEGYCPLLSQESNELLEKCLNPDGTCTDLKGKAKEKCKTLKTSVDDALKKENKDKLENQCHPLLEECHFYGPNCNENDKPNCDELKKDCENKGFTYTPPGSIVDPIEPVPGLLETIGLEEIYKRSAREGVFIGKLRELSRENFLALITPYQRDPNNYKTKCKEELKNNCKNYIFLPSKIKDLCEKDGSKASTGGDKNCETLQNDIQNKCDSLKVMLKNKKAIDNSDPSTIYTWGELLSKTYLREGDCADLESQCFYLKDHCTKDNLDVGCQNLRRACYKKGLDDLAYVALEERLRGRLDYTNYISNPTDDEQKLLKHCKELGTKSVELFTLCMDPKDTLDLLKEDIYEKAYILKPILDMRRDFPTEKDCLKLQEKCEHLEADSNLVKEACHTLKTRCKFRDLSEGLKLHLLDEREDMLKNETICIGKLEIECLRWNRKRENPFSFPCALRNDSCKLMIRRVKDHCRALETNIKSKDVVNQVDKANNPLEQEKTCMRWMTHCYNLMPNCDELVNKTGKNDGPCKQLKEKCDPIIGRWNNEGWLMHQLRGNLTNDQCKGNLDDLCSGWNTKKNETLDSFCKDPTKKNDTNYRDELCKKLGKRIEEQCPVLVTKLEKEKGEVEEMYNAYEKIKKQAEEAFKNTTVVISTVLKKQEEKKIVRRDVNKSTESSKQEPMSVLITAKEAYAIELSAQAMSLYMELNEKCKLLLLDCGFTKECPGCENACKVITPKCTSIKAPEVKPPAVITKECKSEAGTEKGQGSESKPTGEGKTGSESKPSGDASKPSKSEAGGKEEKKCDPVKTVDKWTTTTSTYTTTTTSTKTTTLKVTLTSTRKCKPTKCTTGKGEPTKGGDEEVVVPSGGKRWLPRVGIAIVGVVVAVM